MYQSNFEYYGPVYVRLGRSAVEVVNTDPDYKFEIGKGIVLHEGDKDVLMIASGMMVQQSLKAIEQLKEKELIRL